jgi:type III pantothenate kinase
MILAIDIGNSAIKFGLFEGETLSSRFSIPTNRNATADDIKLAVGDHLRSSVDAVVICSVVADIEHTMRDFLREMTDTDPVFVRNSFDFGLRIDYAPLESLGTDRLVNAFAAVKKFGAPCIVCSLGTATTIDVVSAEREFLGGIIAPGIDAMGEALHLKAPRLPKLATAKPEKLLGNSTEDSIQSGIYNGYVAMVEGLITRMRSESGVVRVVGTGGNAERLSAEFAGMMVVDPDLMLNGLMILATR